MPPWSYHLYEEGDYRMRVFVWSYPTSTQINLFGTHSERVENNDALANWLDDILAPVRALGLPAVLTSQYLGDNKVTILNFT